MMFGRAPLMRIIQTLIELSSSQGVDKGGVILELVPNRTPYDRGFRIILCKFRHQNVIRVRNSATLVMHYVKIASYCCPHKTVPWESRVGGDISGVPILVRVGELTVVVGAKSNNCTWQILNG